MIDMNKEIIFKDGWTLDGGPLTEYISACACDAIRLGYQYGLKLDRFYCADDMLCFYWRGTKKSISAWYTYVSATMMRETEEERNKVLQIIANK